MTSSADALRGRASAFLLLPLSLVPLYFAVPRIRSEVASTEPGPRGARRARRSSSRRRSSRAGGRCRLRSAGGPGAGLPRRSTTRRPLLGHPARSSRSRWRCCDAPASRSISIAEYVRFLQGDTRGPAEAADPDHVRRRAPRLVPRRRQDPRRARVPRDHVRDRRIRGGGQRLLPELGRAAPDGRAAAAGTCRSTPASCT